MNTSQNTTHTPSEAQKHPRSTAGTQQQQYTSSGTTQVNLATLPPFQLATHPGFQANYIPMGTLYSCAPNTFSSATISLLATGLSWRSRLRGTQGGRVYTRHEFGPRLGSVARALGVQSRASWQVITGSHSTSPSVAGQWKPHNLRFLLRCCLLLLYHVCTTPRPSSSLLCGSLGTTAVEHHVSPAVTVTDGASVCACVPCFLSNSDMGRNL